MPIYEYRCQDCRRAVSVWVRRMGQEAERCPRCGGQRLTRLVSRFALARSDESRLENLADDAALAGVDENDPSSVARFIRRVGELGEEGGPEIDQAVEEMEHGGAGAAGEDTAATI
jgi:putative FmdB family regulatory protein